MTMEKYKLGEFYKIRSTRHLRCYMKDYVPYVTIGDLITFVKYNIQMWDKREAPRKFNVQRETSRFEGVIEEDGEIYLNYRAFMRYMFRHEDDYDICRLFVMEVEQELRNESFSISENSGLSATDDPSGSTSSGDEEDDGGVNDVEEDGIITDMKDNKNDNNDKTDNDKNTKENMETEINEEEGMTEKPQDNDTKTFSDDSDLNSDDQKSLKSKENSKSDVISMPQKMEHLKSSPKLEIDLKNDSEIHESKSKVKDDRKVNKGGNKHSRPETPPLQRLMKQDPLPLFASSKHGHHSPAKKVLKESYFSPIPFSLSSPLSSIRHAPTHPKQTMSYKAKMYSNKLHHKLLNRVPPLHHSSSNTRHHDNNDQPLDLSKKSSHKEKDRDKHHKGQTKTNKHLNNGYMSNNLSSSLSSLESLQQRFGGDLHMRYMRKPISGLLPVMPDILPRSYSSTSPLSKHINSMSKHSTKPNRPDDSEKSEKTNLSPKSSVPSQSHDVTDLNSNLKSKSSESAHDGVGKGDDCDKYTNHRCSCKKSFNTLYDLSLHLQETGHLPAGYKQANLMDYPKLVRGQDMWLNQESEQTKRILRCMQCGESFRSLPMLTVHMMQTQHYTKIVSSEHGRRSHKCSAYCDREMDRECIFKCKVCNSAFSDMEGLANHMILSGHHKKNILRSNSYLEYGLKSKRKRYLSDEDSLDVGCNPTVAALLEYKRKCLSQSFTLPSNGHSRLADSPNSETLDDSTISCENCGERIETSCFVEHVRLCLKQKGDKLFNIKKHADDTGSEKSEFMESQDFDEDEESLKMFERPCESDEEELDSKFEVKSEKKESVSSSSGEKEEEGGKGKRDEEAKISVKCEKSDDVIENNEIESEALIMNRLIKQEPITDDSEMEGMDSKEKHKRSEGKKESIKNLDIIDPGVGNEDSNGDSALQAMQSFIQKSFSMKFNYKRGNVVLNASEGSKSVGKSSSLHSGGCKIDKLSPMSLFEKYKNFHPLHPNNGNIKMAAEKLGNSETESLETGLKNDLQKLEKLCKNVESGSPNKEMLISKSERNGSDRSGSVGSQHSEPLASKYLNVDEEENAAKVAGKDESNSALNSLSSFVYGQTLTSEHPLDSLQKLITKTDIPTLMANRGSLRLLPRNNSPQDASVPLNLSIKKERVEEENEEADLKDYFSDQDGSVSSSDSEGNMEYRCTACNRHFASKGSYRYHLSRCHLSSVKKYGLKEAFNMSPYIYLPLDHTAKFSKYYEMAQELANKGK